MAFGLGPAKKKERHRGERSVRVAPSSERRGVVVTTGIFLLRCAPEQRRSALRSVGNLRGARRAAGNATGVLPHVASAAAKI
ncbi:hypothetical protein BE20_12135 [Sorangium cellulosum]|uniref:Uncharacterized protein n=1 Tax=Sorangium cellulosum TaxID=56 RepID=A0A150SIJ5_SORCE|nr:hypothetical protein BE18_41140 [Sorangium cellulosum]KYF92286.1 hypothetical protein BE20_12135 [Sorangium cellulosum]